MPSKRRNPQKQAVVAAMQTFSADGKLHASMSMVLDSFRVRVHNTVDNSLVVDYKHQETAKCHGLYLDNDLLAICLDSGSVLLYSIVQGSISTLTGLASPCVDFAIGKTHCYALGSNGTLIEYESKSGASTRTLATKKACSTLAISKKYLALGGNQIDLVDLKTFKVSSVSLFLM